MTERLGSFLYSLCNVKREYFQGCLVVIGVEMGWDGMRGVGVGA